MKILMIHAIDAAMEVYKNIEPTLFVDDVSAERVADDKTMVEELVGFTKLVGLAIMDSQMELSNVKCKCNASTDALGKKLEAGLKKFKVTYEKKVKSLGAGLAGGRRRNTDVQKRRLRDFRRRVKNFRRLEKVGVKVDTSC